MPWPWIVLFIALWGAVLYAIVLVAGVSRRVSELESGFSGLGQSGGSALDVIAAGPRIGSSLPEFPDHPELSTASVGGLGRVILFVSSSCAPCVRLADQLNQPDAVAARPEFADLDLVVVTDDAGRELFENFASGGVVVQRAGEVAARLGVRATPFAVAVDREGVVAVGLPRSAADIADLAAKCRGPEAQLRTASI
jgi:hypothetical protein